MGRSSESPPPLYYPTAYLPPHVCVLMRIYVCVSTYCLWVFVCIIMYACVPVFMCVCVYKC